LPVKMGLIRRLQWIDELWLIREDKEDGLCLRIDPTQRSKYHILLNEPDKKDPDIACVNAIFKITLTELAPNKTNVKVTPLPGWYKITVDVKEHGTFFNASPQSVSKEIPTSTFFEYTFLLKLGELLGEKNMPPINTDITKAKEVIT
ncbi:MAG: hypothetical protein ACD_79C00038G0004, partial [uncultured bacterium]